MPDMLKLKLDRFDLPPDTGAVTDGPGPEWSAGFLAGELAGREAAMAEQTVIRSELVQTLGDMAFGYAEAHGQILAALRPLFAALVEKVLPAILHESFGAHLLDVLLEQAEKDMSRPVRILLNPAHLPGFSPLISQFPAFPVELAGDPALSLSEALIACGQAETAIDPDRLLADLRECLTGLFTIPQRSQHNG
ncbi:MAG: hypothetical protein GW886_13990 [Rhodobacterales bacterium]|nr:hypothetical protein [Rhodobacterales bacterium]